MPYVEPVHKDKSRKGYVAGSTAKGAVKGAAIGTMVAPGVGTAVGGVVGGLAGFFKGRGEAKKANEAMRQQEAVLNAGERSRIAKFDAGQSLLQGLADRGFVQLSPEAAAAIGKQRDVSTLVGDPLAGGGSAALGDAGNQILDYASQYGINRGGGGGDSYTSGLFGGGSVGGTASGGIPMQELVPFDPKLGRRSAFASGTQNFG